MGASNGKRRCRPRHTRQVVHSYFSEVSRECDNRDDVVYFVPWVVARDSEAKRLDGTALRSRPVIIHEREFEHFRRILCVDLIRFCLEKDALRVSVNFSHRKLVSAEITSPDDWAASVSIDSVLL